jgi:demethylmenaquinone methyltransferase/2-methoxy-6-polyprenyl-1,4-benzoquinol methylase
VPIFDHFGILAPVYDRFIGRRIPDRLLQLLNLPVSGRLLDAAGGTGRIAQLLESKTGGVVVADESSGMLVQARQKGCCSLARSHIEHLPFSDGSFERVIMVDALHHVADQPGSVRELWRVLAPGGVMVIEEMNLHKLSV